MTDLKLMFEELNFSSISTYIQSGNVIFQIDKNYHANDLEKIIEQAISDKFGYDVPVIVRTPDELNAIINQNPFNNTDTDISNLYLTFLKKIPDEENISKAESYNYEPDKFTIVDKNVFLYCEGKFHKTKLSNNFFESKLKVRATTRNWKTILKLAEMGK